MSTKKLLSTPCWIMVAGAEKATVYLYSGAQGRLNIHTVLEQDLPKTSDMMTDQRGRNKNQQMPGGESYAETTDPRTVEKQKFVKDIAEYLYKNHRDYDQLVLAAGPEILGMLRGELHKEVNKRIVSEVSRNLTQYNEHELPDHLDSILKFDRPSYGFDELASRKAMN